MITKPKQPKALEVKYEELEQFDGGGYGLSEDKEEKYAFYIGSFLISFSSLEHSLDVGIANLINDRSHDEGYVIIKDLEVSAKIELFYNLAFSKVNWTEKKKVLKRRQLTIIRRQLETLSTLRNKIAHARWHTLDDEGFVRVDTKTKKEDGMIKFRKLKINLTIMKQGIREMDTLEEKLANFTENLWP
jgi:hypothetical protein